jgi:hypothetical protein
MIQLPQYTFWRLLLHPMLEYTVFIFFSLQSNSMPIAIEFPALPYNTTIATTTTKPTMAIHGSRGIVCGEQNGQGRFGQDSVQKCHYASGMPASLSDISE